VLLRLHLLANPFDGLRRYGSLVRLLTEAPPALSDGDVARLQRGACAGCRAPLPPLAKQSGFLGSRSATTVHPLHTSWRCM
jgi:hypothetical protein